VEENLVKIFRNTRTFAISAPWDSEGQLKKFSINRVILQKSVLGDMEE